MPNKIIFLIIIDNLLNTSKTTPNPHLHPSAHAIFPKIVTRMRKDGDIPYIYYKTYIGVWSGYCIFYISPTFLINHISG